MLRSHSLVWGVSELERERRDLTVVCLGELVFQCRQELRVHLNHEATHVVDDRLKVAIVHACSLLKLLGPGAGRRSVSVLFLQLPHGKDKAGGSDLRRSVLQQAGVEESNLLDVLGVVEDLIIGSSLRELGKALQESVGGGSSHVELENRQDFELHRDDLLA